jgi:hypothetical protein
MFIVEKIETVKSASYSESTINLESRRECEGIMKKIYDENPSYWPYGLDVSSHDGGLYMIREASTHKPIGFTGWQEREEGPNRVGYYSIGILPEYRNNGYAKQAVAKLITIKSANVDCVKALVMKHNTPSLALADALHIPVEKAGTEKKAFMATLKTLAPAIFMDVLNRSSHRLIEGDKGHADTGYIASLADKEQWDLARGAQMVANLGFGAAATRGKQYLTDITNIPKKDAYIAITAGIPTALKALTRLSEKTAPSGFLSNLTPMQKLLAGAGVLGAGGLAYKGVGALSDLAKAQKQRAAGKVQVTLPTKAPGDTETMLELPVGDESISSGQLEKLQRDVRRRLRKETNERTYRRGAKPLLELEDAEPKAASMQKIKSLLNLIHG